MKAVPHSIKNLKQLEMPEAISRVYDLGFYSDLVVSSRKLEALTIRQCYLADEWEEDEEGRLAAMKDDRDERSKFAMVIFRNTKPLGLKKLWLMGLHLNACYRQLTKKIDFLQLRRLGLSGVTGSQKFVRALTKLFKNDKPSLQALCFIESEDAAKATGKDLVALLGSFSGLVYLELSTAVEMKGLNLGCLKTHWLTLRHLSFLIQSRRAFDGELHLAISLDDASIISSKGASLEQLQMALPATAVRGLVGGPSDDSPEILHLLAKCPSLQTLHLHTWPMAHASGPEGADYRSTELYHHDLDKFATHVIWWLTPPNTTPRLEVLCIGNTNDEEVATEDGHILPFDAKRVTYLVGSQTNHRGRSSPIALRMDRKKMRFERPEFDCIDRSMDYDNGMASGGVMTLGS